MPVPRGSETVEKFYFSEENDNIIGYVTGRRDSQPHSRV